MSAPICASALFQEGGRGHVFGQRGQMLFSLPSTVQSSRFFWAGPKYNTGWTDYSEVWAGSPNGGVGQGSSVKRFMLLPILEYILGCRHTSFGSGTWILESTKRLFSIPTVNHFNESETKDSFKVPNLTNPVWRLTNDDQYLQSFSLETCFSCKFSLFQEWFRQH